MDKQKQDSRANAASEGNAKTEKRRQLLKASAAAPLLATLHPSSALAMNSAISCAQPMSVSNKKDPNNGNSLNGDTAYRVAVRFFKWPGGNKNHANNNNGCNVSGAQNLPNNLYYIDDGVHPAAFYSQDGSPHYISEYDLICLGYEEEVRYVVGVFDVYDGDDHVSDPVVYKGLWPAATEYDEHAVSLSGTPLSQSCLTSLVSGNQFNFQT